MGELQEELKEYFVALSDKLAKDDFEDEEEREAFVSNVWKEGEGKEVALSLDSATSCAIDRLLLIGTPEQVFSFGDAIQGAVMRLLCSIYGSRVMQVLLVRLQLLSQDTGKSGCVNSVLAMIHKEIVDGKRPILELFFDPHATHVLRLFFCILTGLDGASVVHRRKSAEKKKKKKKKKRAVAVKASLTVAEMYGRWSHTATYPDSFLSDAEPVFQDIVESVQEAPADDKYEAMFDPSASPTLQIFLQAVAKKGMLAETRLLEQLLGLTDLADIKTRKEEFERYSREILESSIASHVVEAAVAHATPTQYMVIYEHYFQTRLLSLVQHSLANHVVQAAIRHVPSREQFLGIFQELEGSIPSFFRTNRIGVVVELAGGALRFKAYHKEISQHVAQAILGHVPPPTQRKPFLVIQLLRGTVAHAGEEETAGTDDAKEGALAESVGEKQFHVAGCALLQDLLKLEEPHSTLYANSLVNLDTATLVRMAQSPSASHVLDTWLMDGPCSIPLKQKLIRRMCPHVVELAKTRFGSRCVENMYKASSVKVKGDIAAALSDETKQLEQNFFARMTLRNCRVLDYTRQQEEWRQKHEAGDNRRKMFQSILEDGNDKAEDRMDATEDAGGVGEQHEPEGGAGDADERTADAAGEDEAEARRRRRKERKMKRERDGKSVDDDAKRERKRRKKEKKEKNRGDRETEQDTGGEAAGSKKKEKKRKREAGAENGSKKKTRKEAVEDVGADTGADDLGDILRAIEETKRAKKRRH